MGTIPSFDLPQKQKPATRAGFLKSGAGLGIDVFCYFDDLHVYFQV